MIAQPYDKLLLLLHAALAIPLIGSGVHNGVLGIRHLFGLPVQARLRRLYPRVVLALYVPNMLLGGLIYPAFRVDVRAGYLDAAHPWATGMFEIKEHWVALGFWLVLAQVLLPFERDRSPLSTTADALAALAMMVIVWAGLVGLGLVTLRPI